MDFAEAQGTSTSDHLTLLRAYQGWLESRADRKQERSFCSMHFLSPNTLRQMVDAKRQFAHLLGDIGLVKSEISSQALKRLPPQDDGGVKLTGQFANRNAGCPAVVRAVLCAGLYPNVIKGVKSEDQGASARVKLLTRNGQVFLHPSSLLFKASNKSLMNEYMIFHEQVQTSKIYVRDATVVTAYPLLLFGSELTVSGGKYQDFEDGYPVSVDKFIKFNLGGIREMNLLKKFRSTLSNVMEAKVNEPSAPISSKHTKVLDLLVKLLSEEPEPQVTHRHRY